MQYNVLSHTVVVRAASLTERCSGEWRRRPCHEEEWVSERVTHSWDGWLRKSCWWAHGCGWRAVALSASVSDMRSWTAQWMMGLWINLCSGLPRGMDTKVGKIIAWMDGWILEGRGQVLVKWTGKRLMEADRQMDEQTDGGRVRALDVTNRQAGHAKGKGGGPAQPRGYGPRLDICSGVKWRLARAANLSCHSSWWLPNAHLSRSSKSGGWAANTMGQRSRFILCWGWIPRRPLAKASICHSIPPPLYLLGTWCFLCCKTTFVLPLIVSLRGRSIVWERNWHAILRLRRPLLASTGFTFC